MGGDLVIYVFIGICILILIGLLFKKQLVDFLINGITGVVIIYCINGLLPIYAIGINYVTIGIATLLGIPGIITVYIVKNIL